MLYYAWKSWKLHVPIALLLGKEPSRMNVAVIEALLEAEFTLHATCKGCTMLPAAIVNHKNMPPQAFDDWVEPCIFVVGMGWPKLSPTPLVALSKGTAFLNPIVDSSTNHTQHNALSLPLYDSTTVPNHHTT